MIRKISRSLIRKRIHVRVRKKISGTASRPRLNVYRSNTNIYAQLIDDQKGITLVSASSLEPAVKEKYSNGSNVLAAKAVGELLAARALEKGIEDVVFDRNGYIYHGRVKSLAQGARDKGLKF
jgi:large subunit ribosomal protein L18